MSKIMYVQTAGTDQPDKLYAPFILATTAAAMDQEAIIYFLIRGITAMKRGEAEKIKMGDFPSLDKVMEQANEAGVKMYVCEQSTQMFGLEKGDFVDHVQVVGAATLNDLALDADAVISF
ncbi:MAG: DsrE family protein [Methanomassiliicoccales archaeon]